MSVKQSPDLCYERMKSFSNNLKITKFLSDGDSVLDADAGDGVMTELLLDCFPNIRLTTLAQSNTTIAQLNTLADKYPGRLSVIQTDFFNFEPEKLFDAVIFCSSFLRDSFPYDEYKGECVCKEVANDVLDYAVSFLKQKEGQIIIRDGITARFIIHNEKYLQPGYSALQKRLEKAEKEKNDILAILHSYRHICGEKSPKELNKLIEAEDKGRCFISPFRIGQTVSHKTKKWTGEILEIIWNSDGVMMFVSTGGYTEYVRPSELKG